MRGERAQVVGERRRQHWHHPVREVHRRATQLRLRVDRSPGAHVVADIGNRDQEAEPVAMRFRVQGIVEVACISAVDRDQGQRANVDACLGLARVHALTKGVCLAQRLGGEFGRQRVLCKRRLSCQFHRPVRVQALLDHRLGGRGGACVPGDPRDDPVPGACAVQVIDGDRAAQLQAPVSRIHPGAAALEFHRAQERSDASFHHLHERSGPAVGRIARHLHAQPVAMHDAAHLRWRQEDALFESVNLEEAVAGAIGADDAFYGCAVADRGARDGGLAGTPCRALVGAAVSGA